MAAFLPPNEQSKASAAPGFFVYQKAPETLFAIKALAPVHHNTHKFDQKKDPSLDPKSTDQKKSAKSTL